MGGSISQRHGAQPVLSPHRPRKTRRHPRTGKRRRRSTRAASIAGRAKRAGTPASTAHTPVIRRPAALAIPTEVGSPRRRGRVEPPPPSACTPLKFGPHGCFRAEHLRGVAPNGKVGFRIAGSSPGPTERSGSARTGLSPVRSHALPSLLARSPGGGTSYGGDPV